MFSSTRRSIDELRRVICGCPVQRGELYRLYKPAADPKKFRTFVVVSRQALIDSRFSTVICAPVFSTAEGLSTQIAIGPEEGMKHASWVMCDNLVSLPKAGLTHYIGALPPAKVAELNRALRMALDV